MSEYNVENAVSSSSIVLSEDTVVALGTDSTTADKVDDSSSPRMDRYGFMIIDNSFFHQSKAIQSKLEIQKRKDKETEREKKWLKMMKRWDFTKRYRLRKLKRRIRKGIPDGFRGVMWYKILQISAYTPDEINKHQTFPERYPNLHDITKLPIDRIPMQTLEEIERDVDRTFPNHTYFETDGGTGQESLRRLLRWYASIDPEVGYCQGMGFIAGLLLTYMPQETAFYCFASLMYHSKGPLRSLYLPGLIEAKKKLFVFGALFKQFMQPLADHFDKQNIVPTMFAAEWILCVFCRGFSFDLVTRVFDVYTNEGFKIVYRVALALLKNIESTLMRQNFEEILSTLRTISSTVDAHDLLLVAWTIPIKSEDIWYHEDLYLSEGDASM